MFSSIVLCTAFIQGRSLDQELPVLSRLDGQPVSSLICPSPWLNARVTGMDNHLLSGCWRSEFWLSRWPGKAFTHRTVFPASKHVEMKQIGMKEVTHAPETHLLPLKSRLPTEESGCRFED